MGESMSDQSGRTWADAAAKFQASRERQKAWNALDEAVRSKSEGKSRDEVRQLLVDEIDARGLRMPIEPMLEMRLDWIYVGGNPVEKARVIAEAAVAVVGVPFRFKRMLDRVTQAPDSPSGGSHLVRTDPRATVQVSLAADAQQHLSQAESVSIFAMHRATSIRVTLRVKGRGKQSRVAVYLADYCIGEIPPDHSGPFLAELDRANHKNITPVFLALRTRSVEHGWRLDLWKPRENTNAPDED
jgi:hypothetical protein